MKEIEILSEEFIKSGGGDKRFWVIEHMVKVAFVDTNRFKIWSDAVVDGGGRRAYSFLIREYNKMPYTVRDYYIAEKL